MNQIGNNDRELGHLYVPTLRSMPLFLAKPTRRGCFRNE